MQEAHRVGFLVADAEFDFVFSKHGSIVSPGNS